MSEQNQIKWLLNAATSVFSSISDTASLDAELLMRHVLGCDRTYLFTWSDKSLSEQQLEAFNKAVERRKAGEPIAHITGQREFWSLSLAVNPSTLIPRPDTETLVEVALDIAVNLELEHGQGLDLGTGTGAIALALASELPNWDWQGVDLSEDAVSLAKSNAMKNKVTNISFCQSNWFENVAEREFDLIVSNPPYIDPKDPHLAEGDVRFEPLSALIAADNGMADVCYIIEKAKNYLKDDAALLIEHGYDQGTAVRQCFIDNDYHAVQTFKDLAGNERVSVGYLK